MFPCKTEPSKLGTVVPVDSSEEHPIDKVNATKATNFTKFVFIFI